MLTTFPETLSDKIRLSGTRNKSILANDMAGHGTNWATRSAVTVRLRESSPLSGCNAGCRCSSFLIGQSLFVVLGRPDGKRHGCVTRRCCCLHRPVVGVPRLSQNLFPSQSKGILQNKSNVATCGLVCYKSTIIMDLMNEQLLKSSLISASYEQKWEILKPIIERLYVRENWKLNDIISEMKDHYGFVAV